MMCCAKCEQEIKEGEVYFSLTLTKEKQESNLVQVIGIAKEIDRRCEACGVEDILILEKTKAEA